MIRQQEAVLNAVLARGAKEHPDRPLLEVIDGRALTYGELDELGRLWAGAFARVGIGAGDRVVTMLPPDVEAYASWLGLGWLRAMDTGVNTEYRDRMLSYILTNSGARAAVIGATWMDRVEAVLGETPQVERVVVVGATTELTPPFVRAEEFLAGTSPVAPDDPPRVRDICSVVYTSGTTGNSKGVLFPWGEMFASARGSFALDDLGEDDVFYSAFPMHHGSGRFPLVLMTLCGGRMIVRGRFSGSDFWSDIRRYGCTTTAFIGAMSQFVWSQPPRPDDADNPLRMALMFPVIPQHREFQERFGLKIRTLYSMTETGPVMASDWSPDDPSSCGRVQAGYEVRLVDADDYEVPVGTVGEVIVRADEPWVLNAGYLDMPEAKAHAWRNGWFHTGDAMRRDADGNYFFVDRIKDAIRRRGENISSFEVEAHVLTHPDVVECAAIAVPSQWSEDEVMVVVVARDGAVIDPAALIAFLAERMPRFMVPRYVDLATSLPKTDATMRVRKVELRERGVTASTWDREAAGIRLSL